MSADIADEVARVETLLRASMSEAARRHIRIRRSINWREYMPSGEPIECCAVGSITIDDPAQSAYISAMSRLRVDEDVILSIASGFDGEYVSGDIAEWRDLGARLAQWATAEGWLS